MHLADNDIQKRSRVTEISFQMRKFNIEKFTQAYEGIMPDNSK
jgi:hypothetical protein